MIGGVSEARHRYIKEVQIMEQSAPLSAFGKQPIHVVHAKGTNHVRLRASRSFPLPVINKSALIDSNHYVQAEGTHQQRLVHLGFNPHQLIDKKNGHEDTSSDKTDGEFLRRDVGVA